MEDQITDYLGKESEGASEDLLGNQKISLCNKRYGKGWKFLWINLVCVRWKFGRSTKERMPSLWLQIQLHNFCRMLRVCTSKKKVSPSLANWCRNHWKLSERLSDYMQPFMMISISGWYQNIGHRFNCLPWCEGSYPHFIRSFRVIRWLMHTFSNIFMQPIYVFNRRICAPTGGLGSGRKTRWVGLGKGHRWG